MADMAAQWGQLITILMMAVALGMDAFSLGIGIGMKGIRLLDILKLSLLIALLHILMPLTGMFMGNYVGTLLGNVAALIGGVLLVLLGLHMMYSSFRGLQGPSYDYRSSWGMLVFALSVSADSLSVGVSLGLFASDLILTVLTFGIFGGIMSILGLLLGRRASKWMGDYGEALGGIILFTFGILFLI